MYGNVKTIVALVTLVAFIAKHVGQAHPDFAFTSAVVLKNVDAMLYADTNKKKRSLFIELGAQTILT